MREEKQEVEASDGTRFRLEVGDSVVVVAEAGGARRCAKLAYPSAGFGGHAFELSPDERHLVLWFHSGQSEVAYRLWSLPELSRSWSIDYRFGEGEAPLFTPDSQSLVVTWAINPSLCIDEIEERVDSGELPADARTAHPHRLEWARVHTRHLASGVASECSVTVELPVGSLPRQDPEFWPEECTATDASVTIPLGWGGEVTIPFPLPPSVVVPGPNAP